MDLLSRIVFEGFRTTHIMVVLLAVAAFNMFDNTVNNWEVEEDDAEY